MSKSTRKESAAKDPPTLENGKVTCRGLAVEAAKTGPRSGLGHGARRQRHELLIAAVRALKHGATERVPLFSLTQRLLSADRLFIHTGGYSI
jgi:hypothetical protein